MEKTYFIFSYRGARYGLDVNLVREVVWLPALSPIEELPPYIVGVKQPLKIDQGVSHARIVVRCDQGLRR